MEPNVTKVNGEVAHITSTIMIRIDPNMLAEMFWNMPCYRQAEFWEKLSELTKGHHSGAQWLAMGNLMSPDSKALLESMNDHVNGTNRWDKL